MRKEFMNKDTNQMTKNRFPFYLNRAIVCTTFMCLSTPIFAQDANTVADEALNEKLEPDDAEKVKNIEVILKQQYQFEGDTYVMEANELIKHKKYEPAADKFVAAKNKYLRVSKSEPSILKKIAEVDKMHSQTLRLLADALVTEAIENEDDKSSESFNKALNKLAEAKKLDPSRTSEIDAQIKAVSIKLTLFEHDEKVSEKSLVEQFKFDPQKGSIANNILLEKARILYEDRRFTEAREKVDNVLTNQPFNEEAVELMYKINKKIHLAGKDRKAMIRQELIDEVEWKWSDPINNYNNQKVVRDDTDLDKKDKVLGKIYQKLKIVIPKVRFENESLEFVVEWIKKKTKELDPDKGEGVNIIIAVDSKGPNQAEGPGADPAAPADPFAADPFAAADPGAAADPFGADPAAMPANPAVAQGKAGTLSMDADNMPVGEVIKHICDNLGLKYKIEEYAVIIGDDARFQEFETRFYSISAGFLEIVSDKATTGVAAGLGIGIGPDPGAGNGPDFRDYFQRLGVNFPPGAKVKFVPNAMRLVVTNSPENHDKLAEVIRNLGVPTPQVSVESKFIEINDLDIEELGVSWNIARPNHILNPNGINHQNLINDPNTFGAQTTPGGNVPAGQRILNPNLGNQSLANGIRALTPLATGASGAVQAGVNIILGDYIFQGLIRALEQQSTSDVLSAPQVTAVSGKTAVIRVVQERYFPESWDQPDISASFVFGSSPQFGEARDIGIVLEVTPQVEPDNNTISLDLKPQVLEFVRYDTAFNSTINLPAAFGGGVLDVIYSMPILSARTIETRVTIWDGETIMLGGLVTEDVVAVDDRVPYLSDIPYVGRIFRNKGQHNTKRNLLVFVTARLIDPSGLPKRPNFDRALPDFKRL
jgi:general secretion pathway protein D